MKEETAGETPFRGCAGAITVDLWPHPLSAEGRETRRVALPAAASLAALLEAALPLPLGAAAHAVEVRVDGAPAAPAAWPALRLRPGQCVSVRARPRGGDIDPLRTVLQIAVLAASVFAPGAALGLSGVWAAGAGAAIAVGGSLVVNALVPPPLPAAPGGGAAGAAARGAPVYSVSGGANRARPYEPMLLVLGRHRVYPDLAAREYSEFAGGAQYLAQIVSWGVGDLAVGDLYLGETRLGDYDGVETEALAPGEAVTLVAGNVDTAAGADLDDTAWVARTTAAGTTKIAVDLIGRIFRVDSAGSYVSHSVTVQIRYRAAGSSDAWTALSVALSGAAPEPVRVTRTVAPGAAGAWDVEVRRSTAPASSARIHDSVTFQALRAYQADRAVRGADRRTAIRIRASGQLAGRLERLHAVVAQKVPVWDGAAWSSAREASANPAAVLRAFALGWRDAAGRLLAGAGRAAAEIDHAALGRWYAWCEAHDPPLRCDYVLQGGAGVDETEQMIARCGRAAVTWQSGRFGVVWEDAAALPSTLITPARVLAGTMRVDWASGALAEEVTVRYVEPEADWQVREVRRLMPGVTTPAYSAVVTADGVTSARQAALTANLHAAAQLYHRRRIVWEMGADGLTVARGDVVWIAHDLVSGGAAGRLAGGSASQLKLDRAVTLAPGSWLLLDSPGGALHQSPVSPPAGGANPGDSVLLADPLPAAPAAGADDVSDWLWRLYGAAAPPLALRVVAAAPLDEARVRITAIDESPLYHAAATADLDVDLPPARAGAVEVVSLFVAETLVRVGAGYAVELEASAAVAGDWRGGEVLAARGGAAARVVAVLGPGETAARWIEQPGGTVRVSVVPGSAGAPAGRGAALDYTILGAAAPPPPPANFLVDDTGDGTRRFRWTPPAVPDLAGIVIRYTEGADTSVAWSAMTALHEGLLTASPLEGLEPGEGQWVFAARAVDTGGRESETDVRIAAALGPQRTGDVVVWRCPSAHDWPGTAAGALRSGDGSNALEGSPAYAWSDLAAWSAWTSWGAGGGAGAGTAMSFTAEVVDIGAALAFSLSWQGETRGAAAFQFRAGASAEAAAAAAWADYTAGALVSGRHLQLRWRLSGDGAAILRLDHLCWSAHAPTREVRLHDADTSAWAGSAAAGRRIPAAGLAVVTDVQITLQNVGAGASWELTAKSPPTIRIYGSDGAAADATVDAIVRGVASP